VDRRGELCCRGDGTVGRGAHPSALRPAPRSRAADDGAAEIDGAQTGFLRDPHLREPCRRAQRVHEVEAARPETSLVELFCSGCGRAVATSRAQNSESQSSLVSVHPIVSAIAARLGDEVRRLAHGSEVDTREVLAEHRDREHLAPGDERQQRGEEGEAGDLGLADDETASTYASATNPSTDRRRPRYATARSGAALYR
jgi:hypothetical protein